MVNALKQNKPFKEQQLNKSAGILDDFAVRKVVSTREGTIEKVPVNNNDIVNKKYVDGGAGDRFLLNTGDTASGNYNFNANTLFINVDNSRVGIGTATPSAKLEVIYEYDAIVGNAGYAEGRGVVGYGGTGVAGYGSTGLYADGSDIGVNAYSQYETAIMAYGGTYDLYCGTAGGLSYFAGKVGIGTDNPARLLSVAGNTGASFHSSTNYALNLNYLYSTSVPAIYGLTPVGGVGNIALNPGGGNVGIGTITPTSALEVNGQVSITGASRIRATRPAALNFPHNTWTRVDYDTEDYDNLGEYDNEEDFRFTASKAGYYLVNASALINQTAWAADDVWHIAIYKNSALFSIGGRVEVQAASTTYLQSAVTDILYLAANDYIEIYGYLVHVGGANLHASGLYNYLAVHRLS